MEPEKKHNFIYKIDGFVKKFIPNFNLRAIIYFSLIFAIAVYFQIWSISSHPPKVPPQIGKQETVIADDNYWASSEYKDKLQRQTVASFTSELKDWLEGSSQEFVRRKFEDVLYINYGLPGAQDTITPSNFNYLENIGKARYQFAKDKGFASDSPTLVSHGSIICDLDTKTEQTTSIELFQWQYISKPKLDAFINTKPTWKVQVGDKILDVSDQSNLFSFFIFHDPKTNQIFLADSAILENNGVDTKKTIESLTNDPNKYSKIYFSNGNEGCSKFNSKVKSYEQLN